MGGFSRERDWETQPLATRGAGWSLMVPSSSLTTTRINQQQWDVMGTQGRSQCPW